MVTVRPFFAIHSFNSPFCFAFYAYTFHSVSFSYRFLTHPILSPLSPWLLTSLSHPFFMQMNYLHVGLSGYSYRPLPFGPNWWINFLHHSVSQSLFLSYYLPGQVSDIFFSAFSFRMIQNIQLVLGKKSKSDLQTY